MTKKTITRRDLAGQLKADTGSFADAQRFVRDFFNELSQRIAEDGEVRVRGFGVFKCLDKKPRMARNPRTGAAAKVSARRVVSFIPGDVLREAVRDKDE